MRQELYFYDSRQTAIRRYKADCNIAEGCYKEQERRVEQRGG
jgi:hypothetical protein